MVEAPYAALDPAQATVELAASRVMYQMLPAGEYPNTAAVAPHLYGSLEEQFAYGLDHLGPRPTPGQARVGNPQPPGERRRCRYESEREDRPC